ncbi:MAG TPA: SRPBCC family protein [Gemmatimonadaceae bacterium]
MESVEATVVIKRPVEQVFSFYRDFTNLPRFLGDVMSVEPTGPKTSHWTIQGPLGIHVHWTVRVTEERPNDVIRYETVGTPGLRTQWEVYFTRTADGDTQVREVMKTPLGGLGRAALALVGKPPAEEMSANLHRLKELLETGRVTDMSHAVAGKFDRR